MAKKKYNSKMPSKGKGGKHYHDKVRTEKRDFNKDELSEKYGNDPGWYTQNAQLAKDAANIAFTWPTGSPVSLLNAGSQGIDTTVSECVTGYTTPGVMAFRTMLTPGRSDHFNSALNIAARKLFTFVRKENSGSTNYDAPNLMMYILAMDSAYAFYAHMARVYGIMRLYSQRDRYLPNALVESVNCDANDFLANMADFRYFINNTAVKLNAFCVPSRFNLFRRHALMFSGVYQDSPSTARSQYYMFVPAYVYVWDETQVPGTLVSTQCATNNNKYTYATMKQQMTAIIDAISSSQDFNIMSGDIRKAFKDEGLVRVNGVTEDYVVIPTYDEYMLSAIHNMVTYPMPSTNVVEDVNNQCLLFQPQDVAVSTSGGHVGKLASLNPVLSSKLDSPDPEAVFEMTRLISVASTYNDGTASSPAWKCKLEHFGTEVVTGWFIYTLVGNHVNNLYWHQAGDLKATYSNTTTYENNCASYQFSKFNHHPKYWICSAIGGAANMVVVGEIWDVDNYAVVSPHVIEKLHETSLLSLLDVPVVTSGV